MLRDRLIFSLIYADGAFTQSRNFSLQRVGDINWLERNYQFQKTSFSIDELIVVDACRKGRDIETFSRLVRRVVDNVFIPVTAGGGVRTIEDAECLFKHGADKVMLNTVLSESPETAKSIINHFGSQSVVASVDYKMVNDQAVVFVKDGTQSLSESLDAYLEYLEQLQVGEILLNAIDLDGTGFGYDLDTIKHCTDKITSPLIIQGGAGNEKHLQQGIDLEGVSAVATANLFNFIGEGLPNARKHMIEKGANLANWFGNTNSL